MKTYRAVYERDRRGVWMVSVPAVRGCHSYGRSLAEARRNISEALALFDDDVASAAIRDDVHLDRRSKSAVRRVIAARRRAEAERTAANEQLKRTVRSLTGEAGLSLRDVGDLLGLSRQRIQQLTAAR